MPELILYSTGCPKCEVLKQKLAQKGAKYQEFTDVQAMLDMGLKDVPVLGVDGELLSFSQAVAWINQQ